MTFDRLKAGFIAAARAAFPRIDYLALYAGTIVAQGGANSFDVQPDDARVPGLSQVPIELGLPGLTLQLDLSSKPRCLIGWKNGDPALPYVLLFESGAAAMKVTFDATELDLGAAAADAAVKGTSLFNVVAPGWLAMQTALTPIVTTPPTTLPQVAAAVLAIGKALAQSTPPGSALADAMIQAFAAANLSTKVKVE